MTDKPDKIISSGPILVIRFFICYKKACYWYRYMYKLLIENILQECSPEMSQH